MLEGSTLAPVIQPSPHAPLRPDPFELRFAALPSDSAKACVHQLLARYWAVTPAALERVVEFSDRLNAASQSGRAVLFVGVHRENFPTLGYLVHGLREQGVRAFGVYLMTRVD